jgi:hypothetical protein
MNTTGTANSEIRGEFTPRDSAVESLLNGDLDTLIVTGRVPQEAVRRSKAAHACLDIDGSKIDSLRVYYPLLRRIVIPQGR